MTSGGDSRRQCTEDPNFTKAHLRPHDGLGIRGRWDSLRRRAARGAQKRRARTTSRTQRNNRRKSANAHNAVQRRATQHPHVERFHDHSRLCAQACRLRHRARSCSLGRTLRLRRETAPAAGTLPNSLPDSWQLQRRARAYRQGRFPASRVTNCEFSEFDDELHHEFRA